MLVYNPDDEAVWYRFAGQPPKYLEPNAINDLPDDEARHVIATHGPWGVVAVPEEKENQKVVLAEAEERYITSTRKWAEEVMVEWWEKTKSKRELGITVEDSDDVARARAWLKSHGFMK